MLTRLFTTALLAAAVPQHPQQSEIVLATTTSTRDAGLLDSLLPVFERRTGYRVKVIAVGSGQALELGRRGDADVVLAHAPDAERPLVDSGYFTTRRLVMHNEFLIVGPRSDPAHIRGMTDAAAALARVADAHATFVSRGDKSGTHLRELQLWRSACRAPPPLGEHYLEMGQGMGATLQAADEKSAYTLTDVATYLTWRARARLALEPLVQGDTALYNVYHVLQANPRSSTRINVAGAQALADFFVEPATQEMIAAFGKSRFGRSLFVADAGKPDRW
ncbi:MAG TPA: substrate-binding domain-containing protein [Gemmatimonadales bacterium]|jgi:tungstate transport system substrate-binding protein